jgi:signal transduction histidine kinase
MVMNMKALFFIMCSSVLFVLHGQQESGELEQIVINVEEKRKEVISLVKKGVSYFKTHRPEQAFNTFLNDKQFVIGDISLFVFDTSGTVYSQGPDLNFNVWKNFKDYKNAHGIPILDRIAEKAQENGWINYEWMGGYKSSYVEKVEKDGVTYIIGAGWYPVSKEYAVEGLVKAAVAYFYKYGKQEAFDQFSDQLGKFVHGDLYVFAYDFNGYCMAHGDNSALIGRDLVSAKDVTGLLYVQEHIAHAKKGGGWQQYTWRNASKRTYVEPVTDPATKKQYIIGAGYYPKTDRNQVVSLVKKGIKYFNTWGREKAAAQFSYKMGNFIFGDIYLFMYDFSGNVLAHGDNQDLIGQNLSDFKNIYGDVVTKKMIEVAAQGSGWLQFYTKNDLQVTYVEKVSDKQGDYLIGAGFFPDTQSEQVEDLVKRGAQYFQAYPKPEALHDFTSRESNFIKGSFSLFVFNFDQDCLVYGDNYALIWKNFGQFKDPDGKKVAQLFIDKAQLGGGWVVYKSFNTQKCAYVQKVTKEGKDYVIGSAFYK